MDGLSLRTIQTAYATGWLVAAPIGPVNLEIIRRSLRKRLLCGFLVGLGATCVDAAYLVIFTTGLGAAIAEMPTLERILFTIGGLLLAWLGIDAMREAIRYLRFGMNEANRIDKVTEGRWARFTDSLPGHYMLGVAMCASNPMTLAFWSSLSLRFVDLPMGGRFIASGMVWLGALSWVTTLTALIAFARRWVGAKLYALVTSAGGLCMIWFGVEFLWRGWVG